MNPEAERAAAELDLGKTIDQEPLTTAQIRKLVGLVTDSLAMLAQADPATKAELYASLGVELTYHPERRTVTVQAALPCAYERVGGGT